jgi:hypothetical protein
VRETSVVSNATDQAWSGEYNAHAKLSPKLLNPETTRIKRYNALCSFNSLEKKQSPERASPAAVIWYDRPSFLELNGNPMTWRAKYATTGLNPKPYR